MSSGKLATNDIMACEENPAEQSINSPIINLVQLPIEHGYIRLFIAQNTGDRRGKGKEVVELVIYVHVIALSEYVSDTSIYLYIYMYGGVRKICVHFLTVFRWSILL